MSKENEVVVLGVNDQTTTKVDVVPAEDASYHIGWRDPDSDKEDYTKFIVDI